MVAGRSGSSLRGPPAGVALLDRTRAPDGGAALSSARQPSLAERPRLVAEVNGLPGMPDLGDLVRSRSRVRASGLSDECPNRDEPEKQDRQPDCGSPAAPVDTGTQTRGRPRAGDRGRAPLGLMLVVATALEPLGGTCRERHQLIRRRHPAPEVDGHRRARSVWPRLPGRRLGWRRVRRRPVRSEGDELIPGAEPVPWKLHHLPAGLRAA